MTLMHRAAWLVLVACRGSTTWPTGSPSTADPTADELERHRKICSDIDRLWDRVPRAVPVPMAQRDGRLQREAIEYTGDLGIRTLPMQALADKRRQTSYDSWMLSLEAPCPSPNPTSCTPCLKRLFIE